jgi:soluble lytic murein transglycosylase-like protein
MDQKEMEEYLRKEFKNEPILVDIARCESSFRQYDADGKILRGKANKDDIGLMQINEKYNGDLAKKLGYDIYTTEGNIQFAKYLYSKQGADPWTYSSKCWTKGQIARN